MKRLDTLLALGLLLAALPASSLAAVDTLPLAFGEAQVKNYPVLAATLAAKESSPCPQGTTWIHMDDPDRHPAALDRAALGISDENGDAQTCVRPVAKSHEGNLRLAYKVSDLGDTKAAEASANCPDDSGMVDTGKPSTMPFPLTRELLARYDRDGDGRLCLTRPPDIIDGDFMIDVHVIDMPVLDFWCGGKLATIIGTPGNDRIIGTSDDDVIVGLGGDDKIDGGYGNDIICGGEGNDKLDSENNYDDYLYGGPGNDELDGAEGNDHLYGGEGNDFAEGGAGNDTVDGGPGDDTLYGDEEGTDTANAGDDALSGGPGNDELHGGRGNDSLVGDAGDDTLFGDDGNDELFGLDGADYLNGGRNTDQCWDIRATTTFVNCEPIKPD